MIIKDTNGKKYKVEKLSIKKDFTDKLQPDLTCRLVDFHTGALTDLTVEFFFEGDNDDVLMFIGVMQTSYLSNLTPEELAKVILRDQFQQNLKEKKTNV